jgi:hypothetical protein
MPPEWLTNCRIEYARRAGIVPKADWVCRNCAVNSRGRGWQALQVADFKDPRYPGLCLITRRSQVQILPPLPLSQKPAALAVACSNTPRLMPNPGDQRSWIAQAHVSGLERCAQRFGSARKHAQDAGSFLFLPCRRCLLQDSQFLLRLDNCCLGDGLG